MKPDLRVIRPATESPVQAASRLQREAQSQASHAVEELLVRLSLTEAATLEIADLTAAPPGVREECRQLAKQMNARAATIMAILGRGA